MSFWKSGTGKEITGKSEDAFTKDFELIPNNTMALAQIKTFNNVVLTDGYLSHIEITWKITSDDFKGREVRQKIKCFNGKPEQIDRALNMLKLIMVLCQFKPTHSEAPKDEDLMKMNGKILGIKIREFALPKEDGTGFAQGNFVSEVHPVKDFKCVLGEKMALEPIMPPPHVIASSKSSLDSAFSRNGDAKVNVSEDDIPF